MFRKDQKKPTFNAKHAKDLVLINAPSYLLLDPKRQELISKLNALLEFSAERFDSMCLSLIHKIASFFQSLPESTHNYYTAAGGLLNYALHRTEAALSIFRQFLIQDSQARFSLEQQLWMYTLFTASLLRGIGKIVTDFDIELFDKQGKALKKWNPLLESIEVGAYYTYKFTEQHDVSFRSRINVLLARQLMPAEGFAWIASNSGILSIWLALLEEDSAFAGTLGAILDRADAIAIQQDIKQFLAQPSTKFNPNSARISTFIDSSTELSTEKERAMGAEFMQWLKEQLITGNILLNKFPLPTVPGGILFTGELFKLFIQSHPAYKNWQTVQRGFESWGLHQTQINEITVAQFQDPNTGKTLQGLVVNPNILPAEHVYVHDSASNTTASISTLEFVQLIKTNNQINPANITQAVQPLKQLSTAGVWVQNNKQSPSASFGAKGG